MRINNIKRGLQGAYRGRKSKLLYFNIVRSFRHLPLPDFLGIGATKSGTTWLSENLRKHPEIYMSREKEVEFFNKNFHRSLRYYSDKFKLGLNKIKGEFSPSYSTLSLNRIKFIRKIIPDVRLIFLVRNPVERAWSMAVMLLAKLPGRRIEDVKECEFLDNFKQSPLLLRGGYLSVIDTWSMVFSEKQLYIGSLDQIKMQPKKMLCKVFNHIGVSCNVNWELFPFNEMIIPPTGPEYRGFDSNRGVIVKNYHSTDSFIPKRYREILEEIYQPEIEAMGKRFGELTSSWIKPLGTGRK